VQRAQTSTSSVTSAAAAPADRSRATTNATRPGLLRALLSLTAFIVALPVLVVVGSFPSGLIGALIIVIGMRQAWKMTGAPLIQVLGPYRVGGATVPA